VEQYFSCKTCGSFLKVEREIYRGENKEIEHIEVLLCEKCLDEREKFGKFMGALMERGSKL